MCDILAFVTWFSMAFIYNGRQYFVLSETSVKVRTIGYANLTATLGVFYFIGATIGRDHRQQILLVALALVIDMLLPLRTFDAGLRVRAWWLLKNALCLAFALAVFCFGSDSVIESVWLPVLFLGLILLQVAITPLEARYRARL